MTLLTRKRIPLDIDITMCDTTLTRRKVVNYLSIRLDPKLTFRAQIQHATTKAAKITSLLSGFMANVAGLVPSRSKLVMAITDSILLYGSESWTGALKVDC